MILHHAGPLNGGKCRGDKGDDLVFVRTQGWIGENEEEGGPGLGYAEGGDHCGCGRGWGDMVCVMRGDGGDGGICGAVWCGLIG
jgi:hypothetical protein